MSKKPNQHLFKERITRTGYDAQILALSNAIADGTEALKKLLLGTEAPDTYEGHGNYELGQHDNCEGFTSSRPTEKRFCKCLFFLNGGSTKQCGKCKYHERFVLVGNEYRIKDYEVPSFYYGDGIGEIDLVIQEGNVLYATEVKPYKGNSETLLRMVAEIMTYTLGYPNGKYKKAIAFLRRTVKQRVKQSSRRSMIQYAPHLLPC